MTKYEQSKYLSPLEVARALNHSRAYVYSLIALGTLPAKRNDGRWFIASEEVEKRRRVRTEPKRCGATQ